MKKVLRRTMKIFLIILFSVVVFSIISYINHTEKLKKESSLRTPIGSLVEVNGNNMSVYVEGDGPKTLVFMAGGGTCSPILDFKSLYSLLSDEYRIVVVEKFGYGFSDDIAVERDIKSILSDTRKALEKSEIKGPYILCPHSMSGLEALYWAQEYPDEVEAIISLDMAVPDFYNEMDIKIPLIKLGHYASKLGIIRFIPRVSESEAITYGTLSDNEKDIYRAIFYNRTATSAMINEAQSVKDNAIIVSKNGVPNVPILAFISDGSGGTTFDEKTWRDTSKRYISEFTDSKYIDLNCPHYVHDYEYIRISKEIKEYLENLK